MKSQENTKVEWKKNKVGINLNGLVGKDVERHRHQAT